MVPEPEDTVSRSSSHVVLNQVEIAFDDQRAVASAGLLLPATLAERLGMRAQVDNPLAMAHLARGHAFTPSQQCGLVRTLTRSTHRLSPSTRRRRVSELGANALGEVLVPGRVPDCYLGLRLDRRIPLRKCLLVGIRQLWQAPFSQARRPFS
jgi:hypothetical protein